MVNEGAARRNFRGNGPVLLTALGLLIAVSTFPLACGPSFTSCEAHRSCPTEKGGAAGAGPADPGEGGAGGVPGSGASGGTETTGGAADGGADGVATGGAVGEAGAPSATGGAPTTGGLGGAGGSAGSDGGGGAGEADACSPNPCVRARASRTSRPSCAIVPRRISASDASSHASKDLGFWWGTPTASRWT